MFRGGPPPEPAFAGSAGSINVSYRRRENAPEYPRPDRHAGTRPSLIRVEERCPVCGSPDPVPIVYGAPQVEAVQLAAKGRVHLGGRRPRVDAPDSHCNRCGYDWSSGRRFA